jgi:hypothetical protein
MISEKGKRKCIIYRVLSQFAMNIPLPKIQEMDNGIVV